MPAKIRSTIIVSLTIINFIGIILLFSSIFNDNAKDIHRKEKISRNVIILPTYLNSTNNINDAKYISKLSFFPSYKKTIIILELINLYFCFTLLFSFIVGENECDDCCCGCCKHCGCGNCDCNCSNSRDGEGGIIFLLIMIIIILLMYFLTKLCGKHLSRYISLSFISLNNFLIILMSLISFTSYEQNNINYNISVSSFLFICNFFGIILPNLNNCENLRYVHNPNNEINNNQNRNVNNESIIIDNNSNINRNHNTYVIPIVNNEYNANPYIHPNNNSINDKIKNNSETSVKQKLDINEDMGIPPLPTDMPLQNENN